MTEILSSPPILFFLLGLAGALAQAKIRIPEALAKTLAIYLLLAIGLKGGAALSREGLDLSLSLVAIAGILISGFLPLLAYYLLRSFTSLTSAESAAVAAHYGSISIVTFITATAVLDDSGIGYSGGMVGVAALMEAPAIITGLWLVARSENTLAKLETAKLFRDVTFNESIFLLLGALLIGFFLNSKGQTSLAPFFIDPLQGILCLFLLDMGLKAGEGLRGDVRVLKPGPIVLGMGIPVINAAIA
ncbi:MAG: sodium-dependent bicarbonate transport family permease, partial [Rhodospirillales bacterium]